MVLALCLCTPALAQVTGVYTRSFDNARSGHNPNETILTESAVATKGIKLQTVIPVIGDARGMESQPLILPAVKVVDGSTQDVMILPSMANVVRAVNAETGVGIWQTTLCMPIQGGPSIDAHGINDKWGVLSTGVIDPDTQKVYMVAWCSSDGSATPQTARNYFYVLSVPTGAILATTLIDGTSGTQSYNAAMRKQRSSLVLTNVNGVKTVFGASGTVLESGNGAAGWIFALDTYDNKIKAILALSQGVGAGIWMSGQGLAADSKGYLYGVTGNGTFDGKQDFGESLVKLTYTSPVNATPATLQVTDWYTAFEDGVRTGNIPLSSSKLAGISAVTAAMKAMPVGASMKMPASVRVVTGGLTTDTNQVAQLVYGADASGAWGDEDLGSGGGTLIESMGIFATAGKDGLSYEANINNMGKTMPGDNAKTNCAKLAAPPVWFTASPGPVDPCPLDTSTLNFLPFGRTRHFHDTFVQYQSPTLGMTLIGGGENSAIHEWKMSSTGALTYVAQGAQYASDAVTRSPGGMAGSHCSMSSNHNVGAVLWCQQPLGDSNATITQGRLLAIDPETMTTIWNSQEWGITFTSNKFLAPIVWNGRVYLPNYSGGVLVFGPSR
jgi:hypothetical protein